MSEWLILSIAYAEKSGAYNGKFIAQGTLGLGAPRSIKRRVEPRKKFGRSRWHHGKTSLPECTIEMKMRRRDDPLGKTGATIKFENGFECSQMCGIFDFVHLVTSQPARLRLPYGL